MNLDRTGAIAIGLIAAALLTFGLTIGSRRSPTSPSAEPRSSAREHACVTVVAEHSACALPPRQAAERTATPLTSSSVQ
jgi:hypothetical protein